MRFFRVVSSHIQTGCVLDVRAVALGGSLGWWELRGRKEEGVLLGWVFVLDALMVAALGGSLALPTYPY